MKNLKNKALVLFLAMSIVGSASIFTVYAEPEIYAGESEVVVDPGNGSDVTIDTPIVEDPVTPDISDTPVTPPDDTPQEPNVSDTPSYNDTPSYEDNDSSYTPDVNDNINQDSSSQINYDANYYNDMYNNGYYDSNETYYDDSWVAEDTYDPNMSFDEFEYYIQNQGFEITSSNENHRTAEKGKYSITFTKEWIRIRVDVDNKNGIVF